MSQAINTLLRELGDRQGSLVATSASTPVVTVAVHNGRIWRIEIEGYEQASFRLNPEIRAEAAAAHREQRPLESLGPSSVRAINQAHSEALVDQLLHAADLLGSDPVLWDYRPTSVPPRMRTLRGHHIAAITAALRQKGMLIMDSKLERALEAQRSVVPECVAVGLVDLEEGGLIAYKTTRQQPQEVLDLLGAQTRELFCGAVIQQIESIFRSARGDTSTGPMFKLFTGETDNFLHVWKRGDKNPKLVIVFVCRANANLAMVKVQAKLAAAEIERVRAIG